MNELFHRLVVMSAGEAPNGQYQIVPNQSDPRRKLPIVFLVAAALSLASNGAQSQAEVKTRQYQEMLIWLGYYDGVTDGRSGPGTRQAIKKFQSDLGHPATATLTGQEAALLTEQGAKKRDAVGFSNVTDLDAGVSVGIPRALVPIKRKTKWGTSWRAEDNRIVIDTLRFSDTTLQELFDKLSHRKNRQIDYSIIKDNWFVISGNDPDGAGVYVRAESQSGGEIRGFSLWVRKDNLTEFRALPPAMLSSFRTTSQTAEEIPHGIPPPPNVTPNPPPPLLPAASIRKCLNGLGDCPTEAFVPR
jgi:peptidoglycan hydrolase-like protein with peptidoglycan-binding domain